MEPDGTAGPVTGSASRPGRPRPDAGAGRVLAGALDR